MPDSNLKELLSGSVNLDVLSIACVGVATSDDFVLPDELKNVYKYCNGALLFEGALMIRPKTPLVNLSNLEEWNDPTLWKDAYSFVDLSSIVFFAENTFGGQWGVRDGSVLYFEPETGELSNFASSVDEWAQIILEDFNAHTGWALMHEWQENRGSVPFGSRLVPSRAFVLGGEYAVSNLMISDDVQAMRYRGEIACKFNAKEK